MLHVSSASANGRFPGADQLVIAPSDAQHLLVRATFGFIETYDAGGSWQWICEEIVGQIGTADPPLAVTGDGTIVVGVPFQGVAISHDRGCTWLYAPPLANQLVVDLTGEPSDPASLLVLVSTYDAEAPPDAGLAFINRVVETKDNGRTWTQLGMALPRDLIATTIEVAPSDARRIYVGGMIGDPPLEAIVRSEDGGQTWIRTTLPSSNGSGGWFVSAVDSRNPDRLWMRALAHAPDAFGMATTTLRMSADRGETWSDLARTEGSMFGFALSPDGSQLAYGGPQDGIFVGPSDGSGSFAQVSSLRNRCLTWSASGLYACATEPYDPFAVGMTRDGGASFRAIYQLADTCPQVCPDDGPFARLCHASWSDPSSGAALLTRATAESCSVPWAKTGISAEGGPDASRSDAGEESGDTRALVASGGSCQQAAGPARCPALWVGPLLLAWMRTRRRHLSLAASESRLAENVRRRA